MNRRDVLKLGLASLAAGTLGHSVQAQQLPEVRYDKLPQWRGFNLLEKFNGQNRPFREEDFRWISDFGFNFVRLPMDYRAWIIDGDWKKINEKTLEDIDQAVEFGAKYGIHLLMNFHRAPGYTVASPPEAKSVWTDPEAREVCAMHWATFAKRYKGIPNSRVSFNLFNEPAGIEKVMDQCVEAHRYIIKAIRTEDPNRLIVCDGYEWGTKPFIDLANEKVAMATRGYAPHEVSHYKASWAGGDRYPVPTWPLVSGNGQVRDRNWLKRTMIDPWKDAQKLGIGVVVGEFGSHNFTPHDVALRWIGDMLANWKEAGWGYALWNFRGSFGVMDSGRSDVEYEDFHGHKLDRKMLKLLQG